MTDDERRQLVAVIHDYLGEPAAPALVRGLLGGAMGWPGGLNGAQIAGWILDLAIRDPTPAMFLRIVRTCDPAGGLDTVQALVVELGQSPPNWTAGTAAAVLWMPTTKDPFINRDTLRAELALMAAGGGEPAITIEGPLGFGKQTLTRYVEDLEVRSPTFSSLVTELRSEPDRGLLAATVARLRFWLELPERPPSTSSEAERNADVAANEIARELLITPGPCVWWVVNVRETSGVEDGLFRLVDELLGRLQAPGAGLAPRLRIILLAADVSSLPLNNVPPTHARHVLGTITQGPVRDWFAATVPGKTAMHYDAAATTVLDEVDRQQPSPAQWLTLLALQCRAAHRRLAAVP